MLTKNLFFASLLIPAIGVAAPVGMTVVSGNGTVTTNASVTTITSTANSILNWHAFSIANGETVQFNQPSATSAVLNRVTGGAESILNGQLSSNGQVWLINPAGILIGPTGMIDTAGFVASTLNVLDADFLANQFVFSGDRFSGTIRNEGQITASGGPVVFIAPRVENEGSISHQDGQVMLLAGHRVTLGNTATPGVFYELAAPDTHAINLGEIAARNILMQGNQVRNAGTLSANSVVHEGGKVFLVASKQVSHEGAINVSGTSGGDAVLIAGDQVTITGSIDARGINGGAGGTVFIEGKTDIQQSSTILLDGQPFGAVYTMTPLSTEFDDFDPDVVGPDFMASHNWTNGGFFDAGWEISNVTVADGRVTLSVTPCSEGAGGCSDMPYSAGELMSLSKLGYGTYSTRMKAAPGSGVVSSFFLYSGNPSWEEIDIEFLGKDTTKIQFNYFRDGVGNNEQYIDLGFDAALDFHDYAIQVTPQNIRWLVDGVEKAAVSVNIPFAPWRMVINTWPSIGVDGWTGPYDGTPTSATYENMKFTPMAMSAPSAITVSGLPVSAPNTISSSSAANTIETNSVINQINNSIFPITEVRSPAVWMLTQEQEDEINSLRPEDGHHEPGDCSRDGEVMICKQRNPR